MRRLFDDPQLPAELRQDLMRSRAAGQDYPTAAKLLQLRAALSDPARLDLPEPPELGGTVKQLAWRISHPAWKLVVLVALGGTAAWVVRTALPDVQATQAPQLRAAPQADSPVLPPPQAAAPAPVQPSEPAQVVATPEPPAVSRPNPASSSRREIAQLVRIRALLDQDPAAAYQLAVRSEREHPRGVLSEERRALAIIALTKTGQPQTAQRKAREFFARYPQSPMREVIEAALRTFP